MFIGRWQTWHKGHEWLIRQQMDKGKKCWVAIRDVQIDESNPKSAQQVLLDLSNEKFFKENGFYQAIETSGLNPVPSGIDFICVSPKVAEHVILKNFPSGVNELRYVRHKGQSIPQPSIKANHYWISPHSDGFNINSENLKHCIELCLNNPNWKLSLQNHKTIIRMETRNIKRKYNIIRRNQRKINI